jgi:hypothetical protein
MDELAFRRTVLKIAASLMKWQFVVSFFIIINRDGHFVFMTATAENPISHKYVVTK